MRYFDTPALLLAALASFLYGLLSGAAFSSSRALLSLPLVLPRAVVAAICRARDGTSGVAEDARPSHTPLGRIGRHVLEGVLAVVIGIGFLLLAYVLLDGAVRVFCIVLLLLGIYVGYTYGSPPLLHGIQLCERGLQRTLTVLLLPVVWLPVRVSMRIFPPLWRAARTLAVRLLTSSFHRTRTVIRRISSRHKTKSTKVQRQIFQQVSSFVHNAKNPRNDANNLDKNIKK